jgi:superfamily II DNA or RNA helicase
MSCIVSIDLLTDEQRESIDSKLAIRIEPTKFNKNVRYMYPHLVLNEHVILPFSFAFHELGLKRPSRKISSKMNTDVAFTGELREEQKQIKKEAIDFLNSTGCVILNLYPSCGKTAMSIYIASMIKLKCLVVVNKVILMNQWQQSIEKFCPAGKIQLLDTKSDFDMSADFYIINGQNISKKNRKFFQHIQFLICDELHLLTAEKLSTFMNYIHPRYLMGLSATAYRNDDMDKLIPLYYGTSKVIREIYHKHLVYKVNTNFEIKGEMCENGRINWSSVLDAQANNIERNNLIIRIITEFKDRNFLVLVKRVKQGNLLVKELEKNNESVTSLLGSNQTFDKDARILIATSQKCSTGFDHPKLDTLLLAVDCRDYFSQSLFRVFRRRDAEPIIFDILDNNPILFKHFQERSEIYKKHGGKIVNFNKHHSI